MKFKYTPASGFTIIELLMVVAVVAIVLTIVLVGFFNVRNERQLDYATREVRERFGQARSRTLASQNDSSWGVSVAQDQVTLFQGTSFDPMHSENEIYELPGALEIVNVDFGGSDEMYFELGTGEASTSGSLDVRRVQDTANVQTITVSNTGIITVTQ